MSNSIKILSPFVLYCQKVIPLAFDESMSYYECLCALYSYLENTVIPAVNNNAEALEEVQTAMTTLQNYVDNYFENLDVQEEINNKLDEMAEGGELADIIAQYLGLAGVLAYDTVSDMASATNIAEGSILKTLGYSSITDGLGEYYKARLVTNDDVIDGVNIIALSNNTLVAEVIKDNKMRTLDTVSDLSSCDSLQSGEHVNVLGEESINDGRGAIFYIRDKAVGDTDTRDTIFLQNDLIGVRLKNYAGVSTGKMYGNGNTAVISNINNTGIRAQVMGFTTESEIATYSSRDHVIQYKEFRTQAPNVYNISSVDETTVTLASTPDNVYIGSIIDLFTDNTYDESTKYSGFVTAINDNVLTVNHWYLMGNTSEGQVPAGVTIAGIDMPTKVWVNNDNLLLQDESNVGEGVIAEYGLFNYKYENDTTTRANGLDVINVKGKNDYAFQARSVETDLTDDDILYNGLINWNVGTGVLNRNVNRAITVQNSNNQTLAYIGGEGEYYNSNLGSNPIISMANNIFKMNANGTIGTVSLNVNQTAGGSTLNSATAPFIVLTSSTTSTLDSGALGRLVIITSRSALNNVIINGTTYGLAKGKSVILLHNGASWVDLTNTLF